MTFLQLSAHRPSKNILALIFSYDRQFINFNILLFNVYFCILLYFSLKSSSKKFVVCTVAP